LGKRRNEPPCQPCQFVLTGLTALFDIECSFCFARLPRPSGATEDARL
jgi:hypothetical protein